MPQKIKTLAERLEWLFENSLNDEGEQHTYESVQNGTEKLGRKVTASYIRALRLGGKDNPGWQVIQVLARYFGVPINYFYEEHLSKSYLESLKLARQLSEDRETFEIALRSGKLSKDRKEAILNVIKSMLGDP